MAPSFPSDHWRQCAAVLGASGVAAGAFGAHALKQTLLSRGSTDSWRTAVTYQLVHALAILSLGIREPNSNCTVPYNATCNLWLVGTVLFSGSIYALSVGAGERFKLIGPVTPLGGLLMIGGWALLATGSESPRRN